MFVSKRDLWYSRIEAEDVAQVAQRGDHKQVKRFEHNVAKARTKDSMKAFAKLTEVVDAVFGSEHDRLEEFIRNVIRSYRSTMTSDRRRLLERFRYVQAARKVVGVGSVGSRAWIMLLAGRDQQDPLFLQFKEAGASVLEPFLGKSAVATHGRRVVERQQLMEAASDIMLGRLRSDRRGGREPRLRRPPAVDGKGSALVEAMNPKAMTVYADLGDRTLAKAHARSGDAIAISSYLGGADRGLRRTRSRSVKS